MKNKLLYLLIISTFFSCREEINLELPTGEEKLVIEGKIEPGFPPYVFITKSQGYFEEIDSNTFSDLFVTGADVWVYKRDAILGIIDSLKLEEFDLSNLLAEESFTPPIYTNFTNFNPSFSQPGYTYKLSVVWNDYNINATTTIPNITPLDSVFVRQTEDTTDSYKRCEIRAIYTDPDSSGNNILIMSRRSEHWIIDEDQYPDIINDFDERLLLIDCGPDVLINNSTFETFFPRPSNNGGFPNGTYRTDGMKIFIDSITNEKDSIFLPNDVVILKFCQVDKSTMQFYRDVVRNTNAGGNPFSEPSNMVSNIEGGLGIWAGFGAVYYKVPVIIDTVILDKTEFEFPNDIFNIL